VGGGGNIHTFSLSPSRDRRSSRLAWVPAIREGELLDGSLDGVSKTLTDDSILSLYGQAAYKTTTIRCVEFR
jgi:hypothetical protein